MKWLNFFIIVTTILSACLCKQIFSENAVVKRNEEHGIKLLKDKKLHEAFEKLLKKNHPERKIASTLIALVNEPTPPQLIKSLSQEQKEYIYKALEMEIYNDELVLNSMRSIGENESVIAIEEKIEANKKKLEELNYIDAAIGINDEKSEQQESFSN